MRLTNPFRPSAASFPVLFLLPFVLFTAGCGGGGGGSDSSSNGGNVTSIPGGTVPSGTPALLVGDNVNDTNTIQLSQTLASDGYSVSFAPSIPALNASSVTSAKVVVIAESANISNGSAATVKSLLDGGKGVVLIGKVPAVLATGTATLPADTTSISTWFGGVTQLQAVTYPYSYIESNPLVNVPVGISPGDQIYDGTTTDSNNPVPYVPTDSVGSNTAQVAVGDGQSRLYAFAYQPPSGGRLYWQWSPSGTNSRYFSDVNAVFANGIKWAAGLQH